MSLDNPNLIERTITAMTPHKRIIVYVCLGLFALLLFLFLTDKLGSKWWDRGVRKEKQKIENTINEIKEIKAQQEALAIQEAEKRGELKKDVETLANATYGREEAKREANNALANYNKIVNSGANVNATLDDLSNVLEKLK